MCVNRYPIVVTQVTQQESILRSCDSIPLLFVGWSSQGTVLAGCVRQGRCLQDKWGRPHRREGGGWDHLRYNAMYIHYSARLMTCVHDQKLMFSSRKVS